MNHNELWEIFEEIGIQDHLIYFLKNLYVGQKQQLEPYMELTGSKLGKEYDKAIYCHAVFNLHAEYIMQNAGMDESQAGIKIAGKISTPDMQLMPL